MEQIALCGPENVINIVKDVLDPPTQNELDAFQMLIMTTTVIVSVRKVGVVPSAVSI